MKPAHKPQGRPLAPLQTSSYSSDRSNRSVDIDLTGVALAPGPPPVPLNRHDVDTETNTTPGLDRQLSWQEEALNNSAGPKSNIQEKRAMSNFEEISPWSFQSNEGAASTRPKRSRQVCVILLLLEGI